jgi:hypothetical protein
MKVIFDRKYIGKITYQMYETLRFDDKVSNLLLDYYDNSNYKEIAYISDRLIDNVGNGMKQ